MLTLIIMMTTLSLVLTLVLSRFRVVSECFSIKVVNPVTSYTPLQLLFDMKATYVYIVLFAPMIEEFLFRFLPTVIYYTCGTAIPLILLNIAWIIGHYTTVKSTFGEITHTQLAGILLSYCVDATLLSALSIFLYESSIVLAYIVPMLLHMFLNLIACIAEMHKATRTVATYRTRYWSLK